MGGRARGRGVARGRGTPQQPPVEPSRRPGAESGTAAVSQAHVGGGDGNGNGNGSGAGRAAHRGGAREVKPGAGAVTKVATGMESLSLGTGDPTRQQRPRREICANEPNTRPSHITDKRGTAGVPIQLLSNYFKLVNAPGWQMYQYHVDFNPTIDSKKLRKGLLGTHGDKLFSSYLFDGMMLFSSKKLPDVVTEVFSERNYDKAKIRIIFKRTAELSPKSPKCIQVFNVMMRQILMDMKMKEIQRSFFSPSGARRLDAHKLEVWSGFNTSILQYEESVMLNVDLSHKVLRTDSVLDTMYATYHQCRRNMAQFKDMASKKLVGQVVLTRYNDKTYRVDDIEWDIHPTMSFKRGDKDITYVDYYKEAYDVPIRDLQQPMLVHRPKRKDQREGAPEMLYLLPELCTMTGLTDDMKSNFRVMKDLSVHTRVEPTKRAETLNRFRKDIGNNPKASERLRGWGLEYSNDLVQLTGRRLPPENVTIGRTQAGQIIQKSAEDNADWSRHLRGKLYTTVNLQNWAIIYTTDSQETTKNFVDCLNRVAPPFGMNMNAPKWVRLNNNSTSAFLDAIRASTDESVQMMVVVLPTNKKELYDAVKKQCCLETPIPSQCVTTAKLNTSKGLMSIVSKIAIQINCKLGGEAWALEVPLQNLMVVGIDSYHDSAKKGCSVGGFVASLNTTLTRYFSQSTMQMSHQELINTLKSSMAAALKKYHAINGSLPDRIFVYRDGVGDGQLPVVVEHEVKQILEAMPELGSGYKPKVTVIVVKKRINSRFFARQGQNSLANPGPGTIIDTVATRPESYDFFVISQSVRQGTVTPTHYNVIWDESGLKPDHIQRLTYKLCHLYYNWPGTIRVPAPCQYAHKLAFLTGQSLHKTHHLSLSDKLFYL